MTMIIFVGIPFLNEYVFLLLLPDNQQLQQVEVFVDIGERQEAQILKFNAHLVCHVHLIANFLSFHMSLVVVVKCGAGNALRGFEIGMFYFF